MCCFQLASILISWLLLLHNVSFSTGQNLDVFLFISVHLSFSWSTCSLQKLHTSMPVPTIAPWQIVLATYCMAYANISTWPIDGCAMAPYQFDQSVVATVCTNVLHKYLYAQLFDLKLTLSCFTLAIYMMFHWFFPSVWCLDHPIDCSNAASYCEWLFSKWSSITTWRVHSCSSIILLFCRIF